MLLLCAGVAQVVPAVAQEAPVEGVYKVVLFSGPQEVDLALVTVKTVDGKTDIAVSKAQQILGRKATVENLKHDESGVSFAIQGEAEPWVFTGKPDKDGVIRGVIRSQGRLYPAQVVSAAAEDSLNVKMDQSIQQKLIAAIRDVDPDQKVEKLRQLAEELKGKPAESYVLQTLLSNALRPDAAADQVEPVVERLLEVSGAYGPAWLAETKNRTLSALRGKKGLVELTFKLAQEADQNVTEETPLETRAMLATALAEAAESLGKSDLAAATRKRVEDFEAKLDEEYHEKVPPFKPEPVARKDPQSTRVVLMELFTGAQCPPCVAADVAFDALIDSYKPADLITLQYHLHIPGPDPLTNADTIARARYYPDLRGTPSTFFNGKTEAGGGGSMAMSQGKYEAYRKVIDEQLSGEKLAQIELKAALQNDAISIKASAHVAEPKPESKLRLRLALVEETIKYVGGNRLRFHHHVVRAMPGGVEGVELKDGKVEAEQVVNLAELRSSLTKYLDEFAADTPFPNPLPPIKLEKLSVVAFVQDDADKTVLHAVIVPLEKSNTAAE
jgi:hypothetical protein